MKLRNSGREVKSRGMEAKNKPRSAQAKIGFNSKKKNY